MFSWYPTIHPLVLTTNSLVLNPTGDAPLSAALSSILLRLALPRYWCTAGTARHGVRCGAALLLDTTHEVPVLGLYPNYTNDVGITFASEDGWRMDTTSVEITTGALPPNLPTAITVTTPRTTVPSSLNLVSNFSASNPQMPLVANNFGDIRWVLDFRTHPVLQRLTYDCGISRLRNGHYLFGDKSASQLYEADGLDEALHT